MAGGKRPRTPEGQTADIRPGEVFLSHSSQDHRFAGRIVEVLRRHGVPVWYAPTNILGAQQWHDEIGRALARCDWFVVILTRNAIKSRWVKYELNYAIQDDRYQGRILSLLKTPGDYRDLSWTLSSFQYIDFSRKFEQGCREMLRTWGLGYVPE